MRILAIEHELPTPRHASLRDLFREEARAVWELQKRDIVRAIWFTASDRRAVLLLECASAASAREQLASLPLVLRGYSEFQVLELHAYDGFERLFAENAGLPPPKPAEPPEY